MTSLWWPGDHRAGKLMTDGDLLEAMIIVESTWSQVLVAAGIAPTGSTFDVEDVALEPHSVAADAEVGGNPVIPLVQSLRAQLPEPAASWLHRGLTSQDVLDSAIVRCAQGAAARIAADVGALVQVLVSLTERHRSVPIVARTLTQAAVPTTFGAKTAAWLRGVLDARDDLATLVFPVQLGGAAGNLSGLVELAGTGPARSARALFGPQLGLASASPWHTERAPITRIGDAAARASDSWGRIANDVVALGRPEIGELAEGTGGGSSTMPGKANPVLSTLVRRHALAAPQLAATLHLAAASQVDERADGAWHAEWDTLARLLRRTVVAGSQALSLVSDLQVNDARMGERVLALDEILHAEQRSLAAVAGHSPSKHYDGLVGDLIDETLARAAQPPTGDTP